MSSNFWNDYDPSTVDRMPLPRRSGAYYEPASRWERGVIMQVWHKRRYWPARYWFMSRSGLDRHWLVAFDERGGAWFPLLVDDTLFEPPQKTGSLPALPRKFGVACGLGWLAEWTGDGDE